MAFRVSIIAAVVLLVGACQGGTSSSAALPSPPRARPSPPPAVPSPCMLLSQADVDSLLPGAKGVLSDRFRRDGVDEYFCTWAVEGKGELDLFVYRSVNGARPPWLKPCKDPQCQPIAGLGESAGATMRPGSTSSVMATQGDWAVEVTASKGLTPTEDQLISLVRTALAKVLA